MRAFVLSAVAALCCVLSTGCATFVTGAGPDQKIKIGSQPAGARVYVDGQYRGMTPISVAVTRSDHHTVRLERDGYQPYEHAVKMGLNPWLFGNVILGGLIGIGIDTLDGAIWWVGGDVNAKLVRGPATETYDQGGVASAPIASPAPTPAPTPPQRVAAAQRPAPAPAVAPAAAPARAAANQPPIVLWTPAQRSAAQTGAQPAAYRDTQGSLYQPSLLPPRRPAAAAGQ